MYRTTIVTGTLISLAWASTASAQEDQLYFDPATGDTVETSDTEVLAPDDALEIGVQGGYTQPFGELTDGREFNDIVDAGGSIGAELGWRFSPYVSLSGLATFHEQGVTDSAGGTDIRGTALTLQGTFHFMPFDRVDPYLTYGAGYRMLWTKPEGLNNDTFAHGFQLARLAVGADVRVTDELAVGPIVGADVNLFLWENAEAQAEGESFDDPRPSTFLFAGLAGRFDVGGERVAEDDRRPLPPTTAVSY